MCQVDPQGEPHRGEEDLDAGVCRFDVLVLDQAPVDLGRPDREVELGLVQLEGGVVGEVFGVAPEPVGNPPTEVKIGKTYLLRY